MRKYRKKYFKKRENRERRTERMRKYYATHKDYWKGYFQKNKKRLASIQREKYKNPKYMKRYREYQREWRKRKRLEHARKL